MYGQLQDKQISYKFFPGMDNSKTTGKSQEKIMQFIYPQIPNSTQPENTRTNYSES